jgi:hypothetical protein
MWWGRDHNTKFTYYGQQGTFPSLDCHLSCIANHVFLWRETFCQMAHGFSCREDMHWYKIHERTQLFFASTSFYRFAELSKRTCMCVVCFEVNIDRKCDIRIIPDRTPTSACTVIDWGPARELQSTSDKCNKMGVGNLLHLSENFTYPKLPIFTPLWPKRRWT